MVRRGARLDVVVDRHAAVGCARRLDPDDVPGHEIVADLDDDSRVVVEPVLSCVSRNITPRCAACEQGHIGNCEMVTFGDLEPGIQTGSCCDTGGGWATGLVAHTSQLHPVSDSMTDEAAVMVEPTACAVHGALLGRVEAGATVVVIGAGTLGLLTVAALKKYTDAGQIIVTARYPDQIRAAKMLGADSVVVSDELPRAVRRSTGSLAIGDGPIQRLTGGAHVVIDCVGSSASIDQALRVVRPRGRVVLVGMPATVQVELTSLWHREIELVGAYTYGVETLADGSTARTFDLAFDLVNDADLGRLVSATYPLARYTEALEHAANAGVRGAFKVAFDLREETERKHL